MVHSALRESLIPLQAVETSMPEEAETSMIRASPHQIWGGAHSYGLAH